MAWGGKEPHLPIVENGCMPYTYYVGDRLLGISRSCPRAFVIGPFLLVRIPHVSFLSPGRQICHLL